MNSLLLLLGTTLFCISSRAALNLLDRHVFGIKGLNFYTSLFWNAAHPFAIALIFYLIVGRFDPSIINWIIEPTIVWHAFAAQLTATAFSLSFRNMTVRSVVVSSKLGDFIVPAIALLFHNPISFELSLFNLFTAALFFPLTITLLKDGQIHIPSSLFLIGTLLFQAILTAFQKLAPFATCWTDFTQLMVCLLGWRVIFTSVPLFMSKIELSSQSTLTFFARGSLAYLSQASFFFCIASEQSLFAWPILNTGPLLSCFFAGWVLKEQLGKNEKKIGIILSIATITYLFYSMEN